MKELIGGVMGLVGFAQQFAKGLPECEAIDTSAFDYPQFVDTVDIAVNPFKHFKLSENDLQMHGQSVLPDVHNGLHAYKESEYELFGEYMGKVLKYATQANYEANNLYLY